MFLANSQAALEDAENGADELHGPLGCGPSAQRTVQTLAKLKLFLLLSCSWWPVLQWGLPPDTPV